METRAEYMATSTVKTKHTPTPWTLNGQSIEERKTPSCAIAYVYDESDDSLYTNGKSNAEFIVRAVNSHEALLKFAKIHHEVCEECEGTGKIYNNADPTSGQWVECEYLTAINEAEGKYDK